MLDLDAERRAFALLQWVPYSLPNEFDEELAAEQHYTRLQRQRSNAALDAFDKQHPAERSTELQAFYELERLGVYTQNDFFSPTKAKHGYYATKLRDHLRGDSGVQPRATSPQAGDRPAGEGFTRSGPDAQSKGKGERPRLKRRDPRH